MMLEIKKLRAITEELVAKDEQLQDRIKSWEYALDAITDLIFITNLEQRITFANAAFYARLNLDKDLILNNYCYKLLCNNTFVCNVDFTGELYIDSLYGWFEYTRSSIYDEDNSLLGYISVLKDITDKKKAEESLRLDEDRLEALLKLTQLNFSSEKELMEYALEEAVRLTGSEIGYLHFINTPQKDVNFDESTIELFAWSKKTLVDCAVPIENHYPLKSAGVWADSMREGRPVIHNDYSSLLNKKGYPEGHAQIIRHMCVPIFNNGSNKMVGVMGVGNKKELYDESDVRQLNLFAKNMWGIVVKRRSMLELEKERNKINNYLNVVGTILVVIDRNEALVLINKRGCELLGLEEKDVIGKNWFDNFVPEAWRPRLRSFFSIADLIDANNENGVIDNFINPIVTNSGEERIVSWHNSILREGGKVVGIISSGEDITEIEAAKKDLELENERFKFVQDELPLLYQSLDSNGVILEVNKKWLDTLGYDREDVINKPISLFLDKNHLDNNYYSSFIYLDDSVNIDNFFPKFIRKDGEKVKLVIDKRIRHAYNGRGERTHCLLHEFTDRRTR
jgi:PAS domain S-box-containing protein